MPNDRVRRTNPEITGTRKRAGAIRSRNSCVIAARSFLQTVFLKISGQLIRSWPARISETSVILQLVPRMGDSASVLITRHWLSIVRI